MRGEKQVIIVKTVYKKMKNGKTRKGVEARATEVMLASGQNFFTIASKGIELELGLAQKNLQLR